MLRPTHTRRATGCCSARRQLACPMRRDQDFEHPCLEASSKMHVLCAQHLFVGLIAGTSCSGGLGRTHRADPDGGDACQVIEPGSVGGSGCLRGITAT